MSRYGAYLDRINALSKKFKGKLRIFPLGVFKNRLNMSFDKSKNEISRRIYFQRFLSKLPSSYYRSKLPLLAIKKDRFIKSWDKEQFYINPAFKKFKNRFFSNKPKSLNFRDNRKKFIFSNSAKKPIYRNRFQKKN